MEICKLINLGNSLACTIPASYRRQLGWIRGTRVALVIEDGSLKIRTLEDYVIKTRNTSAARGPGSLATSTKRTIVP